jgi:acetyltransferase-like isoleucine patch superfamily enzyme
MRKDRLKHSLHLLLTRSIRKRTLYVKEKGLLGAMGENCVWGPWLVPLYPKLIKLHNNVRVHKTAKIITHDVINGFLKEARPDFDFGPEERIGCVELMDNVYISMNATIMPDVRIGPNAIVTAGSVVTSDVPENTVVAGNPAAAIGRFDMYMALRRMGKNRAVDFKNQELPDEMAEKQWEVFERKHAPKGPKE